MKFSQQSTEKVSFVRGQDGTYIQSMKAFHGSEATGECEFYSIGRSLEMTTQTIRRERGFLDTRRLGEGAASRRSG
ncbi:MAG: hypothetical protein R3337_12350, partial [Gammaproteobacteria bacterium]|nr:hypothetical protein [Gammaproteobacteria bacterium]